MRDRQYASKARPVVVIQNDAFDIFDSVILCLFASFDSSQIEIRVPVTPSPENGLHTLSTTRKHKISYYDAAVAAFNGTAMQLLFPNGVPGEPASASVESTGAPGESTATPDETDTSKDAA